MPENEILSGPISGTMNVNEAAAFGETHRKGRTYLFNEFSLVKIDISGIRIG